MMVENYKFKGDKYFNYNNEEEVEKIWKKLFEWGFYYVINSGFHNLNSHFLGFKKLKELGFRKFFHQKDSDKINLGIGIEFLLKANILKNGFLIHKLEIKNSNDKKFNTEEIKKISDLKSIDVINYNQTLSFEFMKNNISKFNIDIEDKTIETLELVQKWRNGIIHQARGPNKENENQWYNIQHLFALLNNQLIDKNGN